MNPAPSVPSPPPALRVRIAGLFTRTGPAGPEMLFVRHAKDGRTYHLLPGGGLEPGESAEAAFRREMREELGATAEPGELLFLIESIPPDRSRHILNLVFRGRFPAGPPTAFVSADARVAGAEWLPAAAIQESRIYPDIRDELVRALRGGAPARVHLGVRWDE